jgi:integrase
MKVTLDAQILERVKEEARKKKVKDAEIEKMTCSDWRVHDLRRTAATMMAKAGVAPHVLAAILNHTPGSNQGVTMIYNRFRYLEERRAALEQWGAYVVKLSEAKKLKVAAMMSR